MLAIVQARMSSTRLAGKVLRSIGGEPLLALMLKRLKRCRTLDRLIVAIPEKPADIPIRKYLKRAQIACFCGDENDVLDRFYQAARKNPPEHIIRFTADSPLIDPRWVDRLVSFYLSGRGRFDYATFGLSFPEGQNAEIFSWESLQTAWARAKLPSEREHVTAYIWKRPKMFSLYRMELPERYDHMRWTVDEPEDLRLVRILIRRLGTRGARPTMEEIIRFLSDHPALAALNGRIQRNEGYAISRKRDKPSRRK